jgi:hypothetical protein
MQAETAKTIVATAPSIERLRILIDKMFCGCKLLILHDSGAIETGKGITPFRWEKKGKRFQAYYHS